MSKDDLSASLRKLRASTQKLNELGDAVNDIFKETEESLAKAGLGFGAWLAAGKNVGGITLQLGFVEKNTKWCICIRRDPKTPDSSPNAFDNYLFGRSADNPWQNWSRDARLAMVTLLPALVDALNGLVAVRIKETADAVADARRQLGSDAE